MDCSSPANACSLSTAASGAVAPDQVILAPGEYAVAGTGVNAGVTMRGTSGSPRPRILTSGSIGVQLDSGATLRDVDIEHTATGPFTMALYISSPGTGALVERVVAHTAGIAACAIDRNPATIRDSVCWNTGVGSFGLSLTRSGVAGSTIATALNVTTVATNGTGAISFTSGAGESAVLAATNVIADGLIGDVQAESHHVTATSKVNLDHSNFDNSFEVGAGDTQLNFGAGNQTGTPLFANQSAGDFHQLAGSPTIDSGIGGAGLGSTDLDGEARIVGTLPDIGADEFSPPAPPTSSGEPSPTAPKKGCKKKRKKRAATAKRCKKKRKRR